MAAGHVGGLHSLVLHLEGRWQGLGVTVDDRDTDDGGVVLQLDLLGCVVTQQVNAGILSKPCHIVQGSYTLTSIFNDIINHFQIMLY